jgi:Sigma-70, region 4
VTSVTRRGSGPGHAGNRAGDAAPPGRSATEPAEAALVLEIWQELVDATLSPDSVRRFRAHPDFMVLCYYDRRRLEVAGRQLYGRTGRLLLAEWARECAWDGGGTVNLSWAELAAGDPGAGVVARDLVAAEVGSLRSARHRAVLTQRLALDGDAPLSLRSIGERMGISGERVRQLQERALERVCRRRGPPGVGQYARQSIAAVLNQAERAGAEAGESLLTLAEAALPAVPVGLAARVLAQLAGHSRQVSKHVAAEAVTFRVVRDAELAREARQAQFTKRAAALLTRLLADTEWPGGRKPAPPQSLIIPQRGQDAETWESVKLGRKVAFESRDELSLIRALDMAPQVPWFCEQPAAIGYIFAGRHRTYYPDLLAATRDGYCILIEVKPLLDMPLAINQAKAAAARAFCARNGWGFLVTDLRRSLNDLLTMPAPEEASRQFADALRETGTMTWQDIKAHRAQCGLTAVQVAALATQRGWYIRLSPYRMTEQPPPG